MTDADPVLTTPSDKVTLRSKAGETFGLMTAAVEIELDEQPHVLAYVIEVDGR